MKFDDVKLTEQTALQDIKIEIDYINENTVLHIGDLFLRRVNFLPQYRMLDLFEAMGSEYNELGNCIFSDDNQLTSKFNSFLAFNDLDVFDKDVLIVEHIILKEQFTKQNVSLFVIKKAIDLLGGGCGVIAIRPFPHQYTQSGGMSHLDIIQVSSAKEKLTEHFQKMGFLKLGKTSWLVITPANKTQFLDLKTLISLYYSNPELKRLEEQFQKNNNFDTLL